MKLIFRSLVLSDRLPRCWHGLRDYYAATAQATLAINSLPLDAAINPGNSGGPLLVLIIYISLTLCMHASFVSDLGSMLPLLPMSYVLVPFQDSSGNLIGINTAIFTNTGASAGIGFAIPMEVRHVNEAQGR